MSESLTDQIARCDREIAAKIEEVKRDGGDKPDGSMLGLADWYAERRLLMERLHESKISRIAYQEGALRTEAPAGVVAERIAGDPDMVRLLHGAMGLATEAGEIADAVKRHVFYGKPLDRTNLVEELGDLEWYMAIIRDCIGVTQAEVQATNNAKLRTRFPDKFTEACALERDLAAEREVLNG